MAPATFDALHIKSLAADLNSALRDPSTLDEAGRAIACKAAKRLTDALETPINAFLQQRVLPNSLACLKIAVDLELFNILAENPDQSITATELAARCGAEQVLIVRIMRVLTANDFAKEAGEATYICTPRTELMTTSAGTAGTTHCFNMNIQSAVKLPDYFRKNGYKNPITGSQTPFQFAADTKESYFGWMHQHPTIADTFNTWQAGKHETGAVKNWADWFPAQQEVLDEAKDDSMAVTVVDVGGGKGASLGNTERLAYDFFTPQPIRGARLYFMASVLHDWDDESSLQILKNTIPAMTKGYSKLYLNERILPDVGCSLLEASVDIEMMANFAGMERTRSQWRELLQRAGFQHVKFWLSPESSYLGIVEASL